jgi:hypothetical protein
MKKTFTGFAAALVLLALTSGAHALTAQQEKMKSCNADAAAKGLDGDARKQFMSGCLKDGATGTGAALTPQQAKMKSCNTDATTKGLKGDARKQFMSECLKGS